MSLLTQKLREFFTSPWVIVPFVSTALAVSAFSAVSKYSKEKSAEEHAPEAGITTEEQKKYMEYGQGRIYPHYTKDLSECNIKPETLGVIIEKEDLQRGDIWRMIAFDEFKGRKYCTDFDGEKYLKWSETFSFDLDLKFDIPTMWACWECDEQLDNARTVLQYFNSGEKLVKFMEKGGKLDDIVSKAVVDCENPDTAFKKYTNPKQAVSQEEKEHYMWAGVSSYLDMRLLKSKGIDSRPMILKGKQVKIYDNPVSIIEDLRGPKNAWCGSNWYISKHLADLCREGLLDDKIYIQWRGAGHLPYDAIKGIREGLSLETANKGLEKGYRVIDMFELKETYESDKFAEVREILGF